jgi:hypothetical protein
MTLEAVTASTAGENERGQHGQCRKDPVHLSLPFARLSCLSPGFYVCSSGGSVRDLRGYAGPIPLRHGSAHRNLVKIQSFGVKYRCG